MNKALFFDIDGTLVSFHTHHIPASAVHAIAEAKANGCKVYIATGRPVPILDNVGEVEHLVDGYVTANGAYCFVGKREICCNPIAPAEVEGLLQAAKQENFGCIVVGERSLGLWNETPVIRELFEQGLGVDFSTLETPIDRVLQERILQVTAFFDADTEQRVMTALPGCLSARWHPAFSDITAVGIDKGRAIALMAAAEGFDLADTVAFGDGGNDINMLKAAGTGVAMGNANPEVKAVATLVTTSVDENGIQQALQKLGIIA